MSSTQMTRRATPSRTRNHPKTSRVVAEWSYNLLLTALLRAAVLMFIAGGTTAELQGLWAYALYAVGISAVIFFVHLRLERRR